MLHRRAPLCLLLLLACDDTRTADPPDATPPDTAPIDAAPVDAARDASPDRALPDVGPVDAARPAPPVITACERIALPDARAEDGPWTVTGWPLLHVEVVDGTPGLRAPGVARPTEITVRAAANPAYAHTARVEPLPRPAGLAEGMAPGCAPFSHGVASGDPAPDGVVIWTRVDPGAADRVRWAIAADPDFSEIVAEGDAEVRADADHTVQVPVTGLAANWTGYYRFTTPDGRRSPLGRTRTAGPRDHVRFATMSCSSIYSGWFNAFRRLAERDDLDLIVHVGDYLYDFVDEDEQVRVPEPYPTSPNTLATWRARHAYYLSDPDLRAARAAHPWFVIWDNHDVNRGEPEYGGGVQAFREWVPMRQPDAERPEIGWRSLDYGPLLGVFMVDDYLFQNEDEVPGGGRSVIGNAQFADLSEWLARPHTWRVLATQKQITALDTAGVGGFDVGWGAWPEDRARFFTRLAELDIKDLLVVTGHNHWTQLADLAEDPLDPDTPYDPMTGEGSFGAELMAASISRGNFDEFIGPLSNPEFIAILRERLMNANPHHVHDELTSHGYGLIDVRADRVVMEMWYSEILAAAETETFGGGWTLGLGEGRATRVRSEVPTRDD